jgi:Na+/H+ antiporter NhaC
MIQARGRRLNGSFFLFVLLALGVAAWAQETTTQNAMTQPSIATPQAAVVPPPPADPASRYGTWVLLPPLVTIVLAIVWQQVIPALAIGILIAAYMMMPCLPAAETYGGGVLGGLRIALERYYIGVFSALDAKTGGLDVRHIKTLCFTLMIGGMVGILAANGGTRAAVDKVARWAASRARGQFAAGLAGVLVFFDDYASAMIVGPSMRPMFDRLKISRAKLAYIVDSTAAPVSSLALVATWVGAEISYIQSGLDQVRTGAEPAFMHGITAYGAFLWSLPFRFYAILAIVMVFIIGWLGRDFGPMLKAERETLDAEAPPEENGVAVAQTSAGRAWYAFVPVLVLVFFSLALLFVTGWPAAGLGSLTPAAGMPRWLGLTTEILRQADPYNSIFYGAFAAIMLALVISLVTRALTIGKAMDAALAVMSRMLPTLMILTMAWAISAAMGDLRLGEVAVHLLRAGNFDPRWLPLLIFLSSCVVSFATGTSWGTMGILCPATITISAHLMADMPVADALTLFYASVGSVLAGSVFGDHCSPISDTTVLSSLATECSLEKHVWTQMPYAVVVALVACLSGEVLCREYDLPAWVGLAVGAAALFLIVRVVGRKPCAATAA